MNNSEMLCLIGPPWKNRYIEEKSKEATAYHEAGHALVAYYTKDSRPVTKITILPRGHSLGHVSTVV